MSRPAPIKFKSGRPPRAQDGVNRVEWEKKEPSKSSARLRCAYAIFGKVARGAAGGQAFG